jgi:RNA-directed DNA polymerase
LLNIRTLGELFEQLGTTEVIVESTLKHIPDRCHVLLVYDREKPGKKPREVVDPQGSLRELQKAIHNKLLLHNLTFSPVSYGGIPGKSQIDNVTRHLGQKFVYTGDIKNFFPCIHFSRVSRLFLALGCSAEVSRVLTRICTYDHRLAPGFVTSPLLADQILRPGDDRIQKLCEKLALVYTRFVDDITISGDFDLKKSGIAKTIATILHNTGFRVHTGKNQFGTIAEGMPILNLRLGKGHPDVVKTYHEETVRRLKDLASLGAGGEFIGPYFGHAELYGRIQYICWVNPNRRRMLMPLWRALDWECIEGEAARRGILTKRKRYAIKRKR